LNENTLCNQVYLYHRSTVEPTTLRKGQTTEIKRNWRDSAFDLIVCMLLRAASKYERKANTGQKASADGPAGRYFIKKEGNNPGRWVSLYLRRENDTTTSENRTDWASIAASYETLIQVVKANNNTLCQKPNFTKTFVFS